MFCTTNTPNLKLLEITKIFSNRLTDTLANCGSSEQIQIPHLLVFIQNRSVRCL